MWIGDERKLIRANVASSTKLKSSIGRSNKFHCFQRINLQPVDDYMGNKRSRITGVIFISWLIDEDKNMMSKNQSTIHGNHQDF